MVMQISEQDIALVTAAVGAAEARTDGEIATIVAGESHRYHDVALIWSLLVALLAMATYAAFPDFYLGLIDRLSGGWQHEWSHREVLTAAFVAVVLKFAGTRLILMWRPLLLALTPGTIKLHRVRARGILLFKTSTENRTRTRTGVLLYLSTAERRAEIVADAAIAAKVAPELWGEAMAVMVEHLRAGRPGEGMAAAVAKIGDVLATHFPHTGNDPDEIPNRMISL
jgi:putative membrane protein